MFRNEFAEGVMAGICFTICVVGMVQWFHGDARWIMGFTCLAIMLWIGIGIATAELRTSYLDERERRLKQREEKLKGKR